MRPEVKEALFRLVQEHPEFASVGTTTAGDYTRFTMTEQLQVEIALLMMSASEECYQEDLRGLRLGSIFIVHEYNGVLRVMVLESGKKTEQYWKKITSYSAFNYAPTRIKNAKNQD